MRTRLLPATLLAILTVTSISACGSDAGDPLGPSLPNVPGIGDGNGGGALSEPEVVDSAITNGTWTDPDGGAIEPVDPGTFTPVDTVTTGSSGASTVLTFQLSGAARLGEGTCGPDGVWTFDGVTSAPHHPNCLAYRSGGEAGNNQKGSCVASPEGFPGLWLNPQAHRTSAYHANCLVLGSSVSTLALSFPGSATLFESHDGSGRRILDFLWNGETVAQLIYHGSAGTFTTGAGVMVTVDNASPVRLWTIDFSQPALSQVGDVTNGDLIEAMLDAGIQVVACNTATGCSLVTLRLN